MKDLKNLKSSICTCIVSKPIVYDLASDSRDSYKEAENQGKVKYIGEGFIYSVNNVVQLGKLNCHFWAYIK